MLHKTKIFLDSYFKGKRRTGQRQATAALTLWENYTKQKASEQVAPNDIDQLIYDKMHAPKEEDRLEPMSLSLYLFYIAKYLGWLGKRDLEKHIMKIRKKLKSEEIAENLIDPNEVLKMLMEVTELQGELLVRLLVWSKIPIGCLGKLKVRHIYEGKKYEMHCRGKTLRGDLYSDIPMIINKIIKEKKLELDDELIDISERQIQKLIPRYAKKVGIPKTVMPKDLRRFGKNRDLRNWLIEDYEKIRKKTMKKPQTKST